MLVKKSNQIDVDARIQEFCILCKEHDLKVTHQRIEIYRALLESEDHPTAEDIYNRIRDKIPMVSVDTIYRTLALFEDHKLISRVQCLSDKGRFDKNLDKHHHFICVQCKTVFDFYWPEFEKISIPKSAKEYGKVFNEKVELLGVCNECQSKST